jgi:multiple sugar transport system permease protein
MKSSRWQPLWNLPLLLAGVSMLLPLAFMFCTALAKPGAEPMAPESALDLIVPSAWHWENFVRVWEVVPFLRYYYNSLFVSLVVTTGQVFTSACAAYAFARLDWPGRDRLFLAYLATMMVPGAVTMLPNFVAMRLLPEILSYAVPLIDWKSIRYLGTTTDSVMVGRLVGLDSYFALIIPGMFSAYGTFLLRQFLLSIPKDLEEAAMIDGCSYWRIFTTVILPLSLPALATLTIFTFMGVWGSFLWPLVIINHDSLRTLPLGLQAFQGQYATEWPYLMAAAILMLIPIVFIFLFGQRFFISGLTVGAVKG